MHLLYDMTYLIGNHVILHKSRVDRQPHTYNDCKVIVTPAGQAVHAQLVNVPLLSI